MKFGSAMHCRPSPFLKEIEGEGVHAESYEDIMSKPVAEEDVAMSFANLRAMLSGGLPDAPDRDDRFAKLPERDRQRTMRAWAGALALVNEIRKRFVNQRLQLPPFALGEAA